MGRPAFDKSTGQRAGAVVRERRTELALTLSEVARRADFDVSQLRKIERAECGTDLAGWRRIAVALDMAPAAFFGRVFPNGKSPVRGAARNSSRQSPNR